MATIPFAIIAALDEEIRDIRSNMDIDSRVHARPAIFEIGKYFGRPIVLVRTGIGKKAMTAACEYAIANYHPGFCLHVGSCGGADPQYQQGDLIIAAAVVDRATGGRIESDNTLVERARVVCCDVGMSAKVGNLVTSDEVIPTSHEKAFVGTEHDAQCIDMESFAFVEVCKKYAVPYLVVRAVFDPLDTEISVFSGVAGASGKIDAFELVLRMVKNPKEIFKLPKMRYFASEVRNAITAFVNAWMEKFPSPCGRG